MALIPTIKGKIMSAVAVDGYYKTEFVLEHAERGRYFPQHWKMDESPTIKTTEPLKVIEPYINKVVEIWAFPAGKFWEMEGLKMVDNVAETNRVAEINKKKKPWWRFW